MEDRRLARHAAWNLFSLTAPMLVAVAAIPALLAELGTDRFAVLTIAWTLIGYSSLFDMGLGRALTKLVSEDTAGAKLAGVVWTGLALIFALGCAGALIFALGSGALARSVLKIPAELQAETVAGLLWIAVAIPGVTLTAGLRGVLEARQRFGSLGAIRTVTGILTFLGPLAAAKLWGGLPAVIFTIAAIRILSLLAHAGLCAAAAPELFSDRHIRVSQAGPLFRFGGWLTVSNLISPLMVSMDRFLVGIYLPVSSVAYYATPFEIVTKLLVIPSSVTPVMFPALSKSIAGDATRARQLYRRGLAAILAILTPATALVVALAYPGLRLWLGDEFASNGYRALQLLAIGVLINAAAYMPSTYLHAAGRPDVNAKLHLIEFPIYLPLACVLIQTAGIEGAAMAWVLRVTLDAALLFWLARRTEPAAMGLQWEAAGAR